MNEKIINVPLAPIRHLISVRTWNLLTRNGFETVSDVRRALADGLRPGDIRGLGTAGLLETRIAIDGLPPEPDRSSENESAPKAPASPPELSVREMLLILGLAEAGMSERAWAWHGGYPGYPAKDRTEAQAALEHLHLVVHGMPRPAGVPDPQNDPREGRDPVVFGSSTAPPSTPEPSLPEWVAQDSPAPRSREPEPVDDEGFEGYVIEPRPGWGQF